MHSSLKWHTKHNREQYRYLIFSMHIEAHEVLRRNVSRGTKKVPRTLCGPMGRSTENVSQKCPKSGRIFSSQSTQKGQKQRDDKLLEEKYATACMKMLICVPSRIKYEKILQIL